MKYVILFEDNPDADPDIRMRHMAEHLRFLETHAHSIEAAGPLSDPTVLGRDGLWIIDVETRDAAEKLVHQDPFWPTGLRKSYAIIPWKQVFSGGERLLEL